MQQPSNRQVPLPGTGEPRSSANGHIRALEPLTNTFYALLDLVLVIGPLLLALHQLGVDTAQLRVVGVYTGLVEYCVFRASNVYRPWRTHGLSDELSQVAVAWTVAAGLVMVSMLATGTADWLNTNIAAVWWGLPLITLLLARGVLRAVIRWLRRAGYNTRYVVVVGSGSLRHGVIRGIREAKWSGLRVAGYFGSRDGNVRGRYLGRPTDLQNYLENHFVDQVWLAYPVTDQEALIEALEVLKTLPLDIRYVPDITSFNLLNHTTSHFQGHPVVHLNKSPTSGLRGVLKEVGERILALLVLLLLSPVLGVIALAVKLTSVGPVLFKQARHGMDGSKIVVYKFRTMKHNCDRSQEHQQATENDPRITPLGRLLRKTSLDELPQLMNVVGGSMALVGPRPHPVNLNTHYQERIRHLMLRHRVKPGITGLAQVNGYRGETDTLDKMERRIEYDLEYINRWTLWLDVKILLLTAVIFLFQKNAH